jgi:lysophospholipase L1-like esterase
MALTLTTAQLEYRLQFAHIEKALAAWAGVGDDGNLAAIIGCGADEYKRIKTLYATRVREAAVEMITEPAFVAQIARLPFAKGSVIAGLGDSITDDWQSWLEILKHVLKLCRAGDEIQVVNAGISGDTSAHMMARFVDVARLKPDWILCFCGTNDARLHGTHPIKTLVSREETEKNLRALRNFGATQAPQANWLWITPATVDEAAIKAHWFLGEQNQLAWRNSDLTAIADVIKRMPDPVVDLQAVFGLPPDKSCLLDDGLHPSLEGQKAILRAVVDKLVTGNW